MHGQTREEGGDEFGSPQCIWVYFLGSVNCSADKKDGNYIFELVDKCIEDIGEKNVVQVVTDNARPNESAAISLRAKRTSIFWNGCAAHCLDLMLEDIGKLPLVEQTIVKAKSLTVFLYAHTRALNLMRTFLGKDLVRCGVTRFATAYLNLRSILDNKKQLLRLFRSDKLNEMGYLDKVKGKNAHKVVPSEKFWKGVDTAINFFEPLVKVLRMVDGDVPAMGFLYGYLLEAKEEISVRFNNKYSQFQEVWAIMDKRWDSKLKTPLHRAGYYLNPFYYYSNKVDIELDGSFREGLVTCVGKMVKDEQEHDHIMEEIERYQERDGSFGRQIASRQCKNKNFDPAKWWLNHGTSAPHLRKLAARILSLTCSSSACERNWSVYEQVHTKRRNKLLHDRMKDLVFVKFNSKLKQMRENKNRDPIEILVADVLEDVDNEWITGRATEGNRHDPEPEVDQAAADGVSSSHGAAAKGKRKKVSGTQQLRRSKRNKIVPVPDDETPADSSSDTDDDNDMQSPTASDDDRSIHDESEDDD